MSDLPAVFVRVLASRLEGIATLADEMSQWAEEAGVPPKAAAHMNLMLDELITNVVLYGYGEGQPGDIRVEARLAANAMHVVLTDHAPAWDPLQAKAPDLESGIEERAVGGLGVHFVRTLADEVGYERIDEGGRGANRVRLVKRFA